MTLPSLAVHRRIAAEAIEPVAELEFATWIKTTLLFLAVFALYFFSRTPALDEHDSIQLAMGIGEFNVWKHQPHPPGYPLVIFLGQLGAKVFGASPDISLHFISALGGGLFVAAWFLTVRLQFNEQLAWWVAGCLAILPGVWMTATKALTDALAAGLLSGEIFAAVLFLADRRRRSLIASALFGAAAAGARPQLILVVMVILFTALWLSRSGIKVILLTTGVLVAACLTWLLPMWYGQWRLQPNVPFWQVYPNLVYTQWKWRLDKPGIYVGAGDWSLHYLRTRLALHVLGWFGTGFGFIQSARVLTAGRVIVSAGLILYFFRRLIPPDRAFWKFHGPWAFVHVLTIFISLAPMARYYLIIFPLLLIVLLRGFLNLPLPWNWSAWLLPALLLYIVIPMAIVNHRDPPPSVRLVRYLTQFYPSAQRSHVVLIFNQVRRHAQWYAPEFDTLLDIPKLQDLPQATAGAAAIYTDDGGVALPPGWYRVPLAAFARSRLIYWKDQFLELYLIERSSVR